MGRYTGPKGKLSRREGINLFLKGSRSHSEKDALARKPYAPGQHGNARKPRLSQYGIQLREKQRVKRTYGMREKQFNNLYTEANRRSKVNKSDKGLELLRLLETRLDNVIYLAGLAPSRSAARQFVTHKHVEVNGKVMNIPSYEVKVGDEVKLKNEKLKPAESLIPKPVWIEGEKSVVKVGRLPERDEIDQGIKEHYIIEFYSR
ncbi:MAG: 30S ribosomal protein S4 [Candidatus Dojkabacteria bacterium]|nr:MAG: 30S ribosomal protein S4 [Candidatus Dojkabacteria bacterium]